MSSNNTTKKSRVDSDDESGDIISLAAVLAEMQEMKSKLCHVESRCMSLQNEMDGMKDRLSRIDELEEKCQQHEEKYEQQEEKCSILEDRCDSLQRSIEILSDENKWEYSASPVLDSHWTGLGFDAEYIEQMEELLSEISFKATLLREGEYLVETITFGQSSDVANGIVLQHDDALLPHWREFANALQLSPDSNIKFTIQNVQLTSSVIDILIPSLKGKLTDLFLYNNGLVNVSDSVEFAVKCMKSNRQMMKLYLTNNQLGNMKNTTTVLDAVISHPSIERIRLDNCLGGDVNGYDALCYLFATNKRWLEIDFDNNSIRTNGGTAIQDYIASNPPLEYLYLASNKLNDNDATLIASALKGNTNLRVLRLENNNITDTVNNTVEKAVYDTTSLNSMADCNNTCKIRGIDFSTPCWYTNCNDSHQNPKWLRAKKIYGLFSTRNEEGTNVQHLNVEFVDTEDDQSLTLKLVPNVLDCIYRYYGESGRHLGTAMPPSKYIPALSIIYEILRGWKMPELYDTKRVNVSGRG